IGEVPSSSDYIPIPRGLQPPRRYKERFEVGSRWSLPDPWNPSLHARTIVQILSSKYLFEPRFVLHYAAMEPERASGEHDQGQPRPECDREAGEENEMPEIHGVAREPIRAEVNDALRRHLHARSSTRARMAIAANKEILQIAPGHEWHAPRHEDEPAA